MCAKSSKIGKVMQRQKAYVEQLDKNNFKYGLTVGAAFVRGMRDIGYKHTGTALDEELDNSIEAGASDIHVVLHDDGQARKNNVSQIAVIDNGCGMIPEMLRVAVLWGGTDRENSRTGIGRFGYGLPSSCVSQGKRFEVYSLAEGGKLHMCAVDLDEIQAGKYTDADGDIIVPEAKPAALPRFVHDYIDDHFANGKLLRGTVIVIDKLDKLTWKSLNACQNNLLEHFGVVYHKLRANINLFVNGTAVEPIDPLFLTPGCRWFDLDADRAQSFDPLRVEVKDQSTKEILGHIDVRFSYMPPTYGSIDKGKAATGKNANPRFKVLKDYNGFIITRMNRVIEVVGHSELTTFMNNDRYIKVEINFPATLDEFFNVPTTKQRVDVADRVWDILKDHGMLKALEQLRGKFKQQKAEIATQQDAAGDHQRASEKAMEQTAKITPKISADVEERQLEAGKRALRQEAERRAAETGRSVEQAQRDIEGDLDGRHYRVAKEAIPGGAFFRVTQIGGTKVLFLNTKSRFFQEIHSGPNSSPQVRAALEVLLFSIGDRMLEGKSDVQAMYEFEIPEWSRKMEFALAQLAQDLSAPDDDETDSASVGSTESV